MAGGSEDFFKAFRSFPSLFRLPLDVSDLGECSSKWYIAHITALEKNSKSLLNLQHQSLRMLAVGRRRPRRGLDHMEKNYLGG